MRQRLGSFQSGDCHASDQAHPCRCLGAFFSQLFSAFSSESRRCQSLSVRRGNRVTRWPQVRVVTVKRSQTIKPNQTHLFMKSRSLPPNALTRGAVTRTPQRIIQTAAAFLALAASGMCSDSWDLSAGYSATNNPNGAWSWGRKWSVEATGMDLFNLKWGTSGWSRSDDGGVGPAMQGGPIMWAKYNGVGYPCYRWTCPESGRYNIDGQFYAADSRGMDSFVYVVINGSIAFSNRIRSYPQSVSFTNNNVLLDRGEPVDFTITWGGAVSSEYSWTGVSGLITLAGPEIPKLNIRASQVELCWQTVSNTWYQVQYRSTLTTNLWTPLTGAWITGDGARCCTTDAVPVSQPQRFYRLSVTNSPPR